MTVHEDRLRTTLQVYEERAPAAGGYADAAIARARSNRRKRVATMGGVLSAVLVRRSSALLERPPQPDQPAGTVLCQDPAAGEEFPLGHGIRLRVAD